MTMSPIHRNTIENSTMLFIFIAAISFDLKIDANA